MSHDEIKIRRLEIAQEIAALQERDCELRRQMLLVESTAAKLQTELAGLDLAEAQIGEIVPHPSRMNRHGGN